MKKALLVAACLLSANGVAFADDSVVTHESATTTTAAPVTTNTTATRSHTAVHQTPFGTEVHHSKSTVNSTNTVPGAAVTTTSDHSSTVENH
jgi:hypothetical protein